MVSDELNIIIKQLNEKGKMIFQDAASAEEIAKFENDNEICLPSKYKEWLLYSDGGEFFLPAGLQMYGIAHKPIIRCNESDKIEGKYVSIGSLASGDPILCEKESEKISIYNHEAGRIEEDEIYSDYFEFLRDLYNMLGIGE